MRYTALDILKAAGVENPKEKIGKMRVNIAGISVNRADHVVNLQSAKTCDVLVGSKLYEKVQLPDAPQNGKTEHAATVAKVQGLKKTKEREAKGKGDPKKID